MKKGLIVFCLVLMLLLPAFVSAQYGSDSMAQVSEQFIEHFQNFLGPFFSVFLGGEGGFLFERILFLIIIIAVVYIVLSNVPMFEDNNPIRWVTTLAVSLLATRFLSETMLVKGILLPYTVLGVALTAGLPLIIYFFFVYKGFDNPFIRKLLWILFIVVFIGLWFSRYAELGDFAWIYFFTGLAALIFFLADGSIRRFMIKQEMAQLDIENRGQYEREIRREINDLRKDLKNKVVSKYEFNKVMKRLRKKLKAVRKM